MIEDSNFAVLDSQDEYALYFNLLSRVFGRMLEACYPDEKAETYEVGIVPGYLRKMLTTVEALRLKYTYCCTFTRSLWIDLSDSGFPNAQEINNIVQDLLEKQERLRMLPAKNVLKRVIVDKMLQEHVQPTDVLCQLSEREYLEALDETKLFLPFTPGDLILKKADSKNRTYLISWACYDFRTSRPYIHLMVFDQDSNKQPLEERGATYGEFLQVIRGEGSRAPDVGILALAIDDSLESIHPKIIKRVSLGPLYAKLLFDKWLLTDEDQRQTAFRKLLNEYGRNKDDFILWISEEMVFSKDQKVTRSILSPMGKVREIFAMNETDPECYQRRATVVHHTVLLPHRLLQNIGADIQEAIPEFSRCRKATYDDQGRIEIHGTN